jgi:hypothetical protein
VPAHAEGHRISAFGSAPASRAALGSERVQCRATALSRRAASTTLCLIRGFVRSLSSRSFRCCLGVAVTVAVCAIPTTRTTEAQGRTAVGVGVGRVAIPVSFGPVSVSLDPEAADATSQTGRDQPVLTELDLDIARAHPGATIHLAPGRYTAIHDFSVRHGWVTISGRGDASPPVIDGAQLWGAQYLRLDDVRFSSELSIDHSTVHQYAQPASHVVLENSTVDCSSTQADPSTEGVGIRGGSQDITLAGDTIRDCHTGLGSIPQDRFSRNIDIFQCTFEHFTGQAIDLGGLSGVRISHSVIAHIFDPKRVVHNDGILFFGNDRNIVITDNVLADSRNQLILLTDPYRGRYDHTSINKHIVNSGNVIYGAGAVAVQDQGGDDVEFIHNTMWHNHFGSLWLLRSEVSGRRPAQTLILGNLIQGLIFYRAAPTVEAYNLIDGAQGRSAAGHDDLEDLDPRFVSARLGDFRLRVDSPARDASSGSAVHRYLLRSRFAPSVVVNARDQSIGAQQPGDQALSVGPPMRASNFIM